VVLQATDVTPHSLVLSKSHQTPLCCAGLLPNKPDNSNLINAVHGLHLELLLSLEEMWVKLMLMLQRLVLPVGGRL